MRTVPPAGVEGCERWGWCGSGRVARHGEIEATTRPPHQQGSPDASQAVTPAGNLGHDVHTVNDALEVTAATVIECAGQPGSHITMPVPMSARQIADDLSDRIRRGDYTPGEKLPSLKEMAELYSVSVSTVQRAIELVRDRALIVGSQGRGIYVADELP